jgi:hypothetical protein
MKEWPLSGELTDKLDVANGREAERALVAKAPASAKSQCSCQQRTSRRQSATTRSNG